MDPQQTVSELTYPIQPKWLITSSVSSFLVLFFLFTIYFFSSLASNANPFDAYIIYLLVYLIGIPISFILKILTRANFHYTLDKTYLIVKSGILSKQIRNTPYGRIQNIVVKQGILDRLFGLASLKIENASEGSGGNISPKQYQQMQDSITSSGNVIMIPGLNKQDAESLKQILQKMMLANPTSEQGI